MPNVNFTFLKSIIAYLIAFCYGGWARPRIRYGTIALVGLLAAVGITALLLPPPRNFLVTEGRRLIDSHGQEVRITGINWFGMQTKDFAPHGLWERSWGSMLDQLVELGFNTVRLPYSTAMLDPESRAQTIDYQLNADLRGLTPLQILDKLVEGAGKRGLRVILDRHGVEADSQAGLWYSDGYDEDRWIKDWQFLAARYRGNSTVIGADLHNEPHTPATWGTGDPATDWRLAAERAGDAILDVNPDWLIFVQGIDRAKEGWYWWGGSLSWVATAPVRLKLPNRLVYSSHDYGPSVWSQPWFDDPSFPENLPEVWDEHWASIAEADVAPVMLAQAGAHFADGRDAIWWRTLMTFMKERGIHYTFWSLNPNSLETGGILLDDWHSADEGKMALLRSYQAPLMR